MTAMTTEEAVRILTGRGGYEPFLNDGKQWWSVQEIVEAFASVGLVVSADTVTRWVKDMPGTESFGSRMGYRAKRHNLLVYFAEGNHQTKRTGTEN